LNGDDGWGTFVDVGVESMKKLSYDSSGVLSDVVYAEGADIVYKVIIRKSYSFASYDFYVNFPVEFYYHPIFDGIDLK